MLKKYICIYLKCGLYGILLECFYTGIISLLNGNFSLTSTTSLWMFPIYGMAVFIIPLHDAIKNRHFIMRGFIYAFLIMTIEYITGSILINMHCCPWNYSNKKLNYQSVIRLDYFPLWMAAGLIFEYLLTNRNSS